MGHRGFEAIMGEAVALAGEDDQLGVAVFAGSALGDGYGDDAVLVVAGSPTGARAGAVVALGSSSHEILLGPMVVHRRPDRVRTALRGRETDIPSSLGWRRPLRGADWSSGSRRDRRV